MSGNPAPVPPSGTADAAFRELLARVIGSGVTHASGPASCNAGRPVRELVHGSLEFGQLPQRLAGCPGPGAWISPGLAAARFLYLLTGRRDLKFIAPFSGGVRKFSADGTYLGGSAYGARLFGDQPGTDQVRRCAQVIASRPNTKRAAATLFPPYTGNETSVDVACCLGIVFLPRSGTLDASVIMRANDALRLLPYNLFEFSMLAELVARLTGLEAGTYRHLAISMHLRGDGDLKLASEFCAGPVPSGTVDMGRMPDLTWDTVTALASLGNALSDCLSGPAGLPESQVPGIVSRAQSLAGPYWRDVMGAAAARGLARKDPGAGWETLFEERGFVSGPLLSAELTHQRRTLAATHGDQPLGGFRASASGRSRPWNDPGGTMSSTGAAWVFGTGGIGSAILDRLSSDRQVVGFDKAPVTGAHPAYQVDLRDRAALKRVTESAAQRYGWPEVLILAAGRVSGLSVEDSSEADACDLILDNILPAVNVLHAAYHLGQPRTRTCILVTSNAAVAARPGQPVYAAAKAAVASLARSLAASWSPAGIRVLAVGCGTVIVDRNRHAVTSRYPDAPLDPGRPGGRLLQPPELAEFIAGILPHAHHLTGQLITLDGGSTLPGLK